MNATPTLRRTSPLCELAIKHGTDKRSPRHEYTLAYHDLFRDRREKVRRVLEVGVGSKPSMGDGYRPGASLRMWEEFFPNAEIVGLDVNESVLFSEGRIRCFSCDQSRRESLEGALGKVGTGFDLIVDDGSHRPEDQLLTLQVLAPALAVNGVYAIEDLAADFDMLEVIAAKPGYLAFELRICPSEEDEHEKLVLLRYV